MKTIELPVCHVGMLIISSIIDLRFGVCWSGPFSPRVFQSGGDHSTKFDVTGREDISPDAAVNAGGLLWFCASIMSAAGPDVVSSTVNWIYAFAISSPGSILMLLKRIATSWS